MLHICQHLDLMLQVDEELAVGTTVDFTLSTTTAAGLGISGSLSLSTDYDNNNSDTATGGRAVTFLTGGTSIVVGDVEISGLWCCWWRCKRSSR